MTSVTVVLRVTVVLPIKDEPWTVTVYVPGVTVVPTSTFMVELFAVGFGLKDAVTPLGSPLGALRLTEPVKPPMGVIVIGYVGSVSSLVPPVSPV
jgi:hypothetical protein